MKKLKKLICLTLVSLFAVTMLNAQDEISWADKTVREIKSNAPALEWQFVRSFCSGCAPPIQSAKLLLSCQIFYVGQRKSNEIVNASDLEKVSIFVYEVTSSADAAKWIGMSKFSKVEARAGNSKYQFGDESRVFEYKDKSKDGVSLIFRKSHIVVEMSGAGNLVERFAKIVAAQIPVS